MAVFAREFGFDGEVLAQVIRATFERREMRLLTSLPVALTESFAEDATKKAHRPGFVRKAGLRDAGSLAETVAAVRTFADVERH